jgi:hypothetical protein
MRSVKRLRGRSYPDDTLRLNLSFVLHERSDSSTVVHAARACARHARQLRRVRMNGAPSFVVGEIPAAQPDAVLTASLGVPDLLSDALQSAGVDHRSMPLRVDAGNGSSTAELFRATAHLTLPDDSPRSVIAASLVLRPGGRDTQLNVIGPFDWPTDRPAALRAIELMIQAYVDQWIAPRQLWDLPAEEVLKGEIS